MKNSKKKSTNANELDFNAFDGLLALLEDKVSQEGVVDRDRGRVDDASDREVGNVL